MDEMDDRRVGDDDCDSINTLSPSPRDCGGRSNCGDGRLTGGVGGCTRNGASCTGDGASTVDDDDAHAGDDDCRAAVGASCTGDGASCAAVGASCTGDGASCAAAGASCAGDGVCESRLLKAGEGLDSVSAPGRNHGGSDLGDLDLERSTTRGGDSSG